MAEPHATRSGLTSPAELKGLRGEPEMRQSHPRQDVEGMLPFKALAHIEEAFKK